MAEQQTDSNRENLAIVLDSLREANKALRRVIEKGANEVGQLEKFEEKFNDTCDKFNRFKEFVQKNNKQAESLKSRLEQDIGVHRRNAESLKRQIDDIKRSIDDKTRDNAKLNYDLNVNIEKLHELKMNNDHQLSSTLKTKSPQPFIQRLQNELE